MQYRYCSRLFDRQEIEQIHRICGADDQPSRTEISRRVCRQLQWLRPDGRLKDMSCRVALLRMQRDGLITLPPPANGNGNGKISVPFTDLSNPGTPIIGSISQLSEVQLQAVLTSKQSRLWNELIARYHYLGYTPLPGAQYRYLITDGNRPLVVQSVLPQRHGKWHPEIVGLAGLHVLEKPISCMWPTIIASSYYHGYA